MDTELASSGKLWLSPWWTYLSPPLKKIKAKVVGLAHTLKKIGEDDPRRIFHSLKVGLALTLVSLFYYISPLFNGFGVSAMWAVLTVVVVMEYTVGGTLSKGLNRTFATTLAGALGVGAHYLAILTGDKGEPVVLGILVFLLGAAATFARFVPEIKKRHDYGVTIFILTFSLVSVTSYRTDEVIQVAHQRLSTVAIGVAFCLGTAIFVLPVWAGQDLHELSAANLDKLASFLKGLGDGYFGVTDGGETLEDKSFLGCYKSVLNSKATEESLANFARWEPGHGRFRFRHPWNQYLKIGALSRQCAYSMDVLIAYITGCEKIQITELVLQRNIRIACLEMSSESSKALTELASTIRMMASPSSSNHHLAMAMAAAGKVRIVLLEEGVDAIQEIVHSATVASLLTQIVNSAQQTAAAVEELARIASFKVSPEVIHEVTMKQVDEVEDTHAVITLRE